MYIVDAAKVNCHFKIEQVLNKKDRDIFLWIIFDSEKLVWPNWRIYSSNKMNYKKKNYLSFKIVSILKVVFFSFANSLFLG